MQNKKKIYIEYNKTQDKGFGIYKEKSEKIPKIAYVLDIYSKTKEFYFQGNKTIMYLFEIRNDRKLNFENIRYVYVDNEKLKVLSYNKTKNASKIVLAVGKSDS